MIPIICNRKSIDFLKKDKKENTTDNSKNLSVPYKYRNKAHIYIYKIL
jgi:hypothetical protein